MKEEWQERYARLKLDLAETTTNAGLIIVEKHWNGLIKAMIGYSFESIEEEIYFFKTVKPLFTAKLELYHLIKAEIKNPFLRLQKFKEKHADFYQYYQSGRTDKDDEWFVHVSNLTSSHDHLVAQLLALQELVQQTILTEQ